MVESALSAMSRIDDTPSSEAAWPRAHAQSTRPTAWRRVEPAAPSEGAPTEALDEGWLVSPGPDRDDEPRSGALSGLSVAVKDNIDVAGLPVRNGTEGAFWRHPSTSAVAWSTLNEAGAFCVGKSAMHEMAWGVITPQIGNPVDRTRIAGGSSGGSAACVRAGASLAALGTDTGGSLRIPAALCGVVSIRPTTGAISLQGITPLAPEQDVVGPMATDVATCAAMLEVLIGRGLRVDEWQPGSRDKLRVGVLTQLGNVDDATAAGYQEARLRLENADVELIPCDTRIHLASSSVSFLRILLSSARLFHEAVGTMRVGVSGELRALLSMGKDLEEHSRQIDRAQAVLASQTARMFTVNSLDAFLTPTVACVAPLRVSSTVLVGSQEMAIPAALTRFTAWASVVGMPAITVPVHTSSLPVGIQVMAPPDGEEMCIEVARRIE